MSERASDFEERQNRYPILKGRINSLLNIVEDSFGDCKKADEAEQRLIEELRLTGNELMRGWASGKESVSAEELRRSNISVIGHGKKNFFGRQLSEKQSFMRDCFCKAVFLSVRFRNPVM